MRGLANDRVIPVLIVGGGPVGLALSIELSRHGVKNGLLTEGLATSVHPKCNTTNARSMEHLRRLGLAREVRFGGLPSDYPTDIVYLARLGGPEMARIRFPSPRQAAADDDPHRPAWQTPEPQHRISQIYLERILLDHASRRLEADIALGREMIAFAEQDDHVVVDVRDVRTGALEQLRCRWLVGCDGGRSRVRTMSGIRFTGGRSAERAMFGGAMVATYFQSADLQRLFESREGFMYWTLNPEIRSVTVAINGTDRFLTHVQAPLGVAAETMDPREFLPRIVGKPFAFEVLSSAIWNAGHRLVAERFRTGRVFLAGDAAHLFTPTGGFGMNTGLDDVANLAWKLAAVEQGWGGLGLLDSYDLERRPVAHRNTSAASEIADMIGDVQIPSDIEDAGPGGQAARARIAEAVIGVGLEEFGTVGVQLGVRYEGSPIVAPDGSPPPPDPRTSYMPSARPGSRLPHFLVDGAPIFDQLGKGFTLLDLTTGSEAEGLVAAAEARGAPFEHLRVPAALAETLLEAKLVLVRPDQHVAWRSATAPQDPDALLDRVLGLPAAVPRTVSVQIVH